MTRKSPSPFSERDNELWWKMSEYYAAITPQYSFLNENHRIKFNNAVRAYRLIRIIGCPPRTKE